MALHTYTPTEWKNAPDHKTTPVNATNLNNIENGIKNAYTDIADIVDGDIGITFKNAGTDLASEKVNDAIVEVNEKTKHGLYEVWKNSSIASFAGQTVSVVTDKELDCFILELVDLDGNTRNMNMVESGKTVACLYTQIATDGQILQYLRNMTVTKVTGGYQFAITDCSFRSRANNGVVTTVTNNGYIIPFRILGIAHND